MLPERLAACRTAAGARPRFSWGCASLPLVALMLISPAAVHAQAARASGAHGVKASGHLVTARELLSQRRWAEAEAELRRLVDANRNDPDAHVMLGMALKRTGKIREAAAVLEQAVLLQPRHRPAREALGGVYLMAREPEKAVNQLDMLKQICAGSCPEVRSLSDAIAGYSP
jgi:Flp pilus assembly protein TadD